MPGLLAVSCARDHAGRSHELFVRARDAYTRFKGLPCHSEIQEADFCIARFAHAQSPYPDIIRMAERDLVIAAAGWWFDPDAPEDTRASLAHLLHRYLQEGESVLDRLQGQYVVTVLDLRKGELTATGDSMGWFPFYVAECNGTAWVSTSALALAAALTARPDVRALRALFMGDAIRSPRSAFDGIRRVAMGERVTLDAGRSHLHKGWMPFQSPRTYRSLGEAVDEGIVLLSRSCQRLRQTWPHWVSDLTSGLDSRLVVAAMACQGGPVHVTVNGAPTDLDVQTARTIAERFGWPLHHFALPHDWGYRRWECFKQGIALTEGELPGHAIDSTILCKLFLRDLFDASIAGAGGELYRDFFWQQEFLKIGRTSFLDISRLLRYRFFGSSRPEMSLFRNDWRADYTANQTRIAQQLTDLAPDALNTAKLDAIYIWKQSGHAGRYGGATFPLLPAPLPLGTAELIEYAIALPWQFRMHGRLVREMITRLHPSVATIPTWYGGSAEPLSLIRPRQYISYLMGSTMKLIRKFGQLTIKHPIFPDPTTRRVPPNWDRDFVEVLEQEGLLNIDNLCSSSLYDEDGLRRFVSRVRADDFSAFDQLYAIISVELLCRLSGITPSNDYF
jgi:hypothetical protein